MILASIPSPDQGVWYVGPFPLRAYALAIILGIVLAVWMGEKRWVARGGRRGQVSDIAVWAVPFGLVGGRLYHVITDYELYFAEGEDPLSALYVWHGGLGIWGAISLGALGAYIGARRAGVKFPPLADAVAPGLAVAQAVGRWGNWFNQELYGRRTDLPWALEIDVLDQQGDVVGQTLHHPTFLYESLWSLGVAALVIWADRRFRLGHGRAFAVYVMGYTAGRAWIENLRVDEVQMDDVLGLRLNVWTSILVFVVAAAYFVWSARRRPGREESVLRDHTESGAAPADEAAGSTDGTQVEGGSDHLAGEPPEPDDRAGRPDGPTEAESRG